ncbi:ATP-dependent RNA helicase DDX [Acrasis kona]|uniref:ATP-dependent RNA helicase n=1 Tax=Acrasis kona TaxID=1008807 RepID=A0AAW2YRD8_9EUKA
MFHNAQKRARPGNYTAGSGYAYHGMLDSLDSIIDRNKNDKEGDDAKAVERKIKRQKTEEESIYKALPNNDLDLNSVSILNEDLVGVLKNDFKFNYLTPVQHHALQDLINGKDAFINSKAKSGKTLAFLLPLIHNLVRGSFKPENGTGVIVLVPTRESALQVHSICQKLMKPFGAITIGCLLDDEHYQEEIGLFRLTGGINLLIGTPGRLMHNISNNRSFKYSNLRAVVLDDCDKMVEMNFEDQIRRIFGRLPPRRQVIIMSSSIKDKAVDLSNELMRYEQCVMYSDAIHSEDVEEQKCLEKSVVYPIELKIVYLLTILKNHCDKITEYNEAKGTQIYKNCLIFFSSRHSVEYHWFLMSLLRNQHFSNIKFTTLHGESKGCSDKVNYFVRDENESYSLNVIFCTDVSSKGLDIPFVDLMVHFDLPDSLEQYKQRLSRFGNKKYINKKRMDTSILMLNLAQVKENKKMLKTISSRNLKTLNFEKEELIITILPLAQSKVKKVNRFSDLGAKLVRSNESYPKQYTINQILQSFAMPTAVAPTDGVTSRQNITQELLSEWIEIIKERQK